eukprot:2578370-Rhodomonas_salina.1
MGREEAGGDRKQDNELRTGFPHATTSPEQRNQSQNTNASEQEKCAYDIKRHTSAMKKTPNPTSTPIPH